MRRLFTALFVVLLLSTSCNTSADVVDDVLGDDSTDVVPDEDDDDDADADDEEVRVAPPSDIEAEVDEIAHVYKTVTGATGTEDLYIYEFSTAENREWDTPLPAMIFFHGGSWTSSTYTAFRINSQYYATQGVICFSVQYRKRNTEYAGTAATYLDCLRDAKSAIRWVRENAEELNIDPDMIVASGGSAGGHLAAAAAMCDDIYDSNDNLEISPAADILVLFNPVVHTGNASTSGFASYSYSSINTACVAEGLTAEDFSPFNNVDGDVPPTLFMVGELDTYIPPATSIEYQRMIEAEGGECKLWLYRDQVHSFFGLTSTSATTKASGFLSTTTHTHEWMREKGFINDNDPQVEAWLTYKGYTNWATLDSFLYDTSVSNISDLYSQWCSQDGDNKVVNGDFEYGTLEYWTSNTDNAVLSTVSSEVINGDNTLLVIGGDNITYQTITVTPGATYEYGYTGRHLQKIGGSEGASPYDATGDASDRIFMQLRYTSDDGGLNLTDELTIQTGTDISKSSVVTIPDGVSFIDVVLGQSGNYAYFDDVYVREQAD